MNSNSELVDYLIKNGFIRSEKVEKAFRNVDRASFMPESYKNSSYEDRPVPIADNATISAPHIVAINTELLNIEDECSVLEIGSGSGYQAAILGELAKNVLGVELNRELVEESRNLLEDYENVSIVQGSGFKPVKQAFDRILYSAATESFEEAERYLEDDGVIVGPLIKEGHQVLARYKEGEVSEHGKVSFVEMV